MYSEETRGMIQMLEVKVGTICRSDKFHRQDAKLDSKTSGSGEGRNSTHFPIVGIIVIIVLLAAPSIQVDQIKRSRDDKNKKI